MLSSILGKRKYTSLASSDVAILPTIKTSAVSADPSGYARLFSRRHLRTLGFASLSLFALGLYYSSGSMKKVDVSSATPSLPPLYEAYIEKERQLPQHQSVTPAEPGSGKKYLWFANHVRGAGWGNALQELFMNYHLAQSSGRAYVFTNYTWDSDGGSYSKFGDNIIPSRIPLSAMITGPINGAPVKSEPAAPLSISHEHFHKICPNPTVVSTDDVDDSNGGASAATLLGRWAEYLSTIEDPCVEIDVKSNQIFNIWVMGTNRVLDIWSALSKSPGLNEFGWSSLIHSAFTSNTHLFPSIFQSFFLSWLPTFPHALHPSASPISSNQVVSGLLAVHIRRGDFVDHCSHLAKWSAQWNGFNQFDSLPDRFDVPPGAGFGFNTPENTAYYMEHCFPSIIQMADKIMSVREENPGVDRVYIMTNGKRPFIEKLTEELEKRGKWKGITSSRDMVLTWEQKYVAQAVDMLVGQRAQAFIGNGPDIQYRDASATIWFHAIEHSVMVKGQPWERPRGKPDVLLLEPWQIDRAS